MKYFGSGSDFIHDRRVRDRDCGLRLCLLIHAHAPACLHWPDQGDWTEDLAIDCEESLGQKPITRIDAADPNDRKVAAAMIASDLPSRVLFGEASF